MKIEASGSNTGLSRRAVVVGLAGSGALLILGCSPSGRDGSAGDTGSPVPAPAAAGAKEMTVFRDPSCGCCESWARIARQAGYTVELRDDQDMPGVKRRLRVPEELASCHTTVLGGLVIEGHVPLEDVARLLRERPPGIKGIAVPGMPLGSPGMEVPDGTKQPFQVIAFAGDGTTSVFRA